MSAHKRIQTSLKLDPKLKSLLDKVKGRNVDMTPEQEIKVLKNAVTDLQDALEKVHERLANLDNMAHKPVDIRSVVLDVLDGREGFMGK